MFMSDAKDILGLGTKEELASSQTPKSKSGKQTKRKRNSKGIDSSNQAHKSSNIEVETLEESRKKFGKKPVRKWTIEEFTNSARIDDLKLSHWKRAGSSSEGYPFAFLNKREPIPHYEESKYKFLKTSDWTKEETDEMLQMASDYYLNWAVVADRFEFNGKSRTINEIKARYFEIEDAVNLLNGLKEELVNFNLDEDNKRKMALNFWLSRSEEDIEKDEEAIKEVEKFRKALLEEEQKHYEEKFAASDINRLSQEDITNFALTSQPIPKATIAPGTYMASELPELSLGSNKSSQPLIRAVNYHIAERVALVRGRPYQTFLNERVAENQIKFQNRLHQISELKGALIAVNQRYEKLSKVASANGKSMPPLPKKCTPAYFSEPRKGEISQFVDSLYSIIPPTKPIPNCTQLNEDEKLIRIPGVNIIYPKDICRTRRSTSGMAAERDRFSPPPAGAHHTPKTPSTPSVTATATTPGIITQARRSSRHSSNSKNNG